MKKFFYIIPGYDEPIENYSILIKKLHELNFKVVFIKISWKKQSLKSYVEEFKSQLIHKELEEVHVLGFSLGAVIALIGANSIHVNRLLLCSLSPCFKDDLANYSILMKFLLNIVLGKNLRNEFKQLSFEDYISNVETHILYGEKEAKELINRCKIARKKLKNSKLIEIKNVKHDISDKLYLLAVLKEIKRL